MGYLSLDRAGATLSTGERQRVQLARSVRNRTTGVLYVMDEPSIGLHPANVDGLLGVMRDLIADGNSVVMVDHDTRILRAADYLVEMGPAAGAGGGSVVAQGTVGKVSADETSIIGPYLSGDSQVAARPQAQAEAMFDLGRVHLESSGLHTVKPFALDIPKGRLIAVTGVSGSGKTTLVLETLIPALEAAIAGEALPKHVTAINAEGIHRANLIDATPIGINVRSTVATYCGVLDDLRRAYAHTEAAKEAGLKLGDFSYNTGSLRCPTCDGTGQISLDVQFLPDVDIACPDCRGTRYRAAADSIRRVEKATTKATAKASAKKAKACAARSQAETPEAATMTEATSEVENHALSLPQLLALSVDEALPHVADIKKAHEKLQTLHDLGLGYLTLGEATPALSGGEAQRLKLASEMGRGQEDAVFVFDEPTIGLHPRDVETLLNVFQRLVEQGATVIVIEHDLDFIANADYVIDMGPQGGEAGGRIVACGTPAEIAANPESITGRYLEL